MSPELCVVILYPLDQHYSIYASNQPLTGKAECSGHLFLYLLRQYKNALVNLLKGEYAAQFSMVQWHPLRQFCSTVQYPHAVLRVIEGIASL